MAMVDIIYMTLWELYGEQLRRRSIEAPRPGSQMDGNEFNLVGWVLGQSSPAEAVEVMHKDTLIQRVPIDVDRPNVAAAFSKVSDAKRSGFRSTVAVPDTGKCKLVVRAVLQDESRVPVGVIGAHRQSGEEWYSEGGIEAQSGISARFFRRMLGHGGD